MTIKGFNLEKRIVITGLGTLNAIANNVADFAAALQEMFMEKPAEQRRQLDDTSKRLLQAMQLGIRINQEDGHRWIDWLPPVALDGSDEASLRFRAGYALHDLRDGVFE